MSSICEQATGLDDKQYWEGFSSTVLDQRVPFSGSLALTHRCNLACAHCYARDENQYQNAQDSELNANEWIRIITEIKDAGCLYLLLTGGEPLLRQDFSEIYSFAKRNGFLITVFTNGTLVTGETAELFRQLPPRLVEITLYGATAEVHDRVTGVPGSFNRARQGIETLIGLGINVGLKSVLMTLNLAEFSAIEKLAQSYDVKFRLDAAIFPSLAGDRSPLDLRVTPEQAVALEMANPERVREWREYFANFRLASHGNKVFACSAGKTNFHIDPDGNLYPCLIARSHKYSLRQGSFLVGWQGEIARIREEEVNGENRCGDCEKKLICGFCPGFFEMEQGQNQAPSDYICTIGKLRYTYIKNMEIGG